MFLFPNILIAIAALRANLGSLRNELPRSEKMIGSANITEDRHVFEVAMADWARSRNYVRRNGLWAHTNHYLHFMKDELGFFAIRSHYKTGARIDDERIHPTLDA